MAKKVAVLVFNPVNGYGLFNYLEKFYEEKIPFRTFAVSDSMSVKTNSGVPLMMDDIVANLKGHEGKYEALVFACGDAIPEFGKNSDKQYNHDALDVINAFAEKGKLLIGHCGAALIFDSLGVVDGKKVAVHPYVREMVKKAKASDSEYEVDGNVFTAQTEDYITGMMPELLSSLK